MIHLLAALLLAGSGQSIGDNRGILRDPLRGPTAVTDKDLRPGRPPDCRTERPVRLQPPPLGLLSQASDRVGH